MYITAASSKAAVAAVVAIGTWAMPAQAAPPYAATSALQVATRVEASTDPTAAYLELNARDRAAFDSVRKVARNEVTVTAEGVGATAGRLMPAQSARELASSVEGQSFRATFRGCWALKVSSSGKARAGNTLFTYGQSTRICVKKGRASSVRVYNVWDETSTPGWRVDKPATRTTFNAGWEGRGRAKYYFVLGVGGWDIQHPTTCLQLRLNRDASHYQANRTCDLS